MIFFSKEQIQKDWFPRRELFLRSLKIGQPENWSPDTRTCDLWSLGMYLDGKLTELNCSDDDRRHLLRYFNRKSRAAEDLVELTVECLNRFVNNNIEKYTGR